MLTSLAQKPSSGRALAPVGVLLSDMGDSLEVSAPVGVAVDGHGP